MNEAENRLSDTEMIQTSVCFQVSFLVSACLILVTLLAIAPLFYSLPICVLASVVIVACIPLFTHYTMWLTYWKNDRYDFAIWVVTFFMTFLAGVDYGLVIGVGFSLVLVHYRMQVSQFCSSIFPVEQLNVGPG